MWFIFVFPFTSVVPILRKIYTGQDGKNDGPVTFTTQGTISKDPRGRGRGRPPALSTAAPILSTVGESESGGNNSSNSHSGDTASLPGNTRPRAGDGKRRSSPRLTSGLRAVDSDGTGGGDGAEVGKYERGGSERSSIGSSGNERSGQVKKIPESKGGVRMETPAGIASAEASAGGNDSDRDDNVRRVSARNARGRDRPGDARGQSPARARVDRPSGGGVTLPISPSTSPLRSLPRGGARDGDSGGSTGAATANATAKATAAAAAAASTPSPAGVVVPSITADHHERRPFGRRKGLPVPATRRTVRSDGIGSGQQTGGGTGKVGRLTGGGSGSGLRNGPGVGSIVGVNGKGNGDGGGRGGGGRGGRGQGAGVIGGGRGNRAKDDTSRGGVSGTQPRASGSKKRPRKRMGLAGETWAAMWARGFTDESQVRSSLS